MSRPHMVIRDIWEAMSLVSINNLLLRFLNNNHSDLIEEISELSMSYSISQIKYFVPDMF